MASSTQYKGYIIMSAGEFSGQWGDPQLNENFIEIADRNMGGITTKSLASADVTLTAEESQNLIVRLTGILPTNRVVTATSFEGMVIIENLTTGSFSVTFTDGVSGTVIPQGARSLVIADSSNGTRIAAGTFSTGTRLIFQQTTAPVGWTKESSSTYNNAALRFVTGSASTGGSVDFTTAFASQTPTGTVGNTTLTLAQIPAHTHDANPLGNNNNDSAAPPSASTGGAVGASFSTTSAGGGQSHTHTLTMNAINLAVKYADAIIAQKD